MKQFVSSITFALFLNFSSHAFGADPGWWIARGVKSSATSSNRSPATVGQAKHMVAMALTELESRLPSSEFVSLQTDVAAIVNLALPATPAEFQKQRGILLVGQLKALAKPFYDHLRILDAAWLDGEMEQAGTRLVVRGRLSDTFGDYFSPYPWTESTQDDSNFAIATLGQLKAVFALRFETIGTQGDSDGDGIDDSVEISAGTSPTLIDTDGDGHPDNLDPFPLDPGRWQALSPISGDQLPPVVTILSPTSATYVSGP
jgi:hypothetical protein